MRGPVRWEMPERLHLKIRNEPNFSPKGIAKQLKSLILGPRPGIIGSEPNLGHPTVPAASLTDVAGEDIVKGWNSMDTVPEAEIDVRGLTRVEAESLVLERYGRGDLSDEQARRMLGFETQFQVHAFLKEHGVYLNYGLEDLEQDLKFSESWSSSPTPHR